MQRQSRQTVIDTQGAYDAAILRGAKPQAAYEAAVAVYRLAYPKVGELVLRHLAAVIVGYVPLNAKAAGLSRTRPDRSNRASGG